MNVSCPQCSTTYRVDPAKVPLGGVRARCSACSGVIPVGIAETVARSTPVSTPIRERYVTPPRPAPVATPPRPMTPPRERPMTPPRSAALPPLRPTPRTPWPSVATPSAPAAPVPPQAARPFIPSQTPISVPAYTPPPPPPRVIPQPPAPSVPTPEEPAAAISPMHPTPDVPVPATAPAPGERRPINPFLARDPSLRAKRLARALVSDMVAYYPAKHSEGLQRGTLKELFREEIKKSYEEYVAQVGAELARSTTHFQEALNEVLGAGKKIF